MADPVTFARIPTVKRALFPVSLTCALIFAPGAPTPALAQTSPIEIVYEEPTDVALRPTYERLKDWGALEELQAFLEPLRLPRKLTVKTAQCGEADAPYDPSGVVTVCYELVDQIAAIVVRRTPDKQFQQTVIMGAFTQAMLHEVANGIFDVLQIPVWGRKEDAADLLSAFLMMQLGEDVANKTMVSAAQLFLWSDQKWTGSDFASASSPDYQRFFNFACIAVARDFISFGGWVTSGLIPSRRAKLCDREYRDIEKAFNLRIMPYVDPDLLVSMRFKPRPKWAP
jgi:hypothetical protein